MNKLRDFILPLPHYMQDLPISDKGYPVPFFVKWFDGKPDFRVIDQQKIMDCLDHRVCWCCGKPLRKTASFVGGPLMAFNLMSAEPANHPECAKFAATACPFMLFPNAARRRANLPEGTTDYAPGHLLEDNPGVTVVIEVRGFQIESFGDSSIAFRALDPIRADWYSEGKPASREKAEEAYRKRICDLKASLTGSPLSLNEIEGMDRMETAGAELLPKE